MHESRPHALFVGDSVFPVICKQNREKQSQLVIKKEMVATFQQSKLFKHSINRLASADYRNRNSSETFDSPHLNQVNLPNILDSSILREKLDELNQLQPLPKNSQKL